MRIDKNGKEVAEDEYWRAVWDEGGRRVSESFAREVVESWYKLLDEANKEKTIPESGSECLHNRCNKCHGAGRDAQGRTCMHMISCPCRKCSVIL